VRNQSTVDWMPISTVVHGFHPRWIDARLGTVDDVAAGVRYLCGPESTWVTGQCIAIDGGHTLRRGPDLTVAMRTR